MKIYCSDLCLMNGDLEQNLKLFSAHGIGSLELMMDGQAWDNFHLRQEELLGVLHHYPFQYSIHTPVWDANLTSENVHLRDACMETYRQAILFAAKLKAAHVVIHPGFCMLSSFSKDTARQRSRVYVEELGELCRNHGLRLLVENVGGPDSSIFRYDEFVHFLDDAGENVGYLIDAGHANLCGWDIPRLIGDLGTRLSALHLHDNDGIRDGHLPVGEGNIPWQKIFGRLKAVEQSCALIVEYNVGTPLERFGAAVVKIEKWMGGTLDG